MDLTPSSIKSLNKHESEYLFDEIFLRRTYLRHGLTIAADAIVFDVGANIGMFSLFALSECASASVYAFEPLPPIFEILESNVRPHSATAHLFRCGLSAVRGETDFVYYPGYSTMSAGSSYADTSAEKALVRRQITKDQGGADAVSDFASEDVEALLDYRFREMTYRCPLRRLSDVIEEYRVPRIDFLKIDVQRAELAVLEGVGETHWPLIQQIAMEVHDEPHGITEGRLGHISDLLRTRGFEVIVEQEASLVGTDRHSLFAARRTSSHA